MGCASSKSDRCRHCRRPYSPISRSYSMQVHHPPQTKGDSYHVVALTSSTLGSLELGSAHQNIHIHDKINGHSHGGGGGDGGGDGGCRQAPRNDDRKTIEEFRMGLVEAKTWSSIITEKIPKTVSKTPTRTPPGEPETINAWELMEGLEDVSPLWSPSRFRSFSFDFGRRPVLDSSCDRPEPKLQENGTASPKPLWLQMEEDHDDDDDDNLNSDSMASEFDPEVLSSFRKSLQQLSPDHPFHLRPVDNIKQPALAPIDSKKFYSWEEKKKDKAVLYFTSLRGIRKTFEDCCHVRAILRAVGVRVDERDVSMHSGFKEELKELLQEDQNINGGGSLPRVFIGRQQIGGAEEIRRMHEDGQLEKLLESCEKLDNGDGGACEACGDIRFLPCETCSGSCKVYYEGEEEEEVVEEEEEEEGAYGFQRCLDCNENGLVRCPLCCH